MNQKVDKRRKSVEKDIINVIRTTQRNNIDLTHIADNKANVLLTLNALMISIIIPFALSNKAMLLELNLTLPLVILTITNGVTILIATMVLKPGDFKNFKKYNVDKGELFSPFFFGNFFKMDRTEFGNYFQDTLRDDENIKKFLCDDLFYIGKRLGNKMTWIRVAFNIFTAGIVISIISGLWVLFMQ